MALYSVTVKLTNAIVRAAEPVMVGGEPRSKLYCDTVVPGLMLRVGASSKTFFVRARIRGRDVRRKIGLWGGEYTLDQAREEAIDLRKQMRKGTDPKEESKRAAAKGITLEDAWKLTKETMKTKGRADRTIDEYGDLLDRYLKAWLERPLIALTREEVAKRHKQIAKDVAAGRFALRTEKGKPRPRSDRAGIATANAVMRAFRATWNRALKQHPELPVCPTINVDWYRVEPKRTAIPSNKLKAWFDGVEQIGERNPIRRDLLKFMLLTGLRSSSAAEIKWDDVNLKRKVLRIPKPKGGEQRAFELPLTASLVAILKERQKTNAILFPLSPFAFPAESESGHVEDAREEIDGVEFSPHDLRRTFITVAEALDVSPYAIKALVNHSLPKADVTAGYITPDVERLRTPLEEIDTRLLQLCRGARVVALDSRRRVG